MIKFYDISTTKNSYYDFKNPLKIKVNELKNLKDILSPYIPIEERNIIPKINIELVSGNLRPVGYRVVNADGLTSLGLRKNPNILK